MESAGFVTSSKARIEERLIGMKVPTKSHGIAVAFAVACMVLVHAAVAAEDSREEWVSRLKKLRGHKAAAFRVGPELSRCDPDFGLEVVRAAWPALTDFQVKRGLLKAFHFSKDLRPKKHPYVIKILHLGVMDSDERVQKTALVYASEYSLQKFVGNTEGYRAWYEESKDRPVEEVLHASHLRTAPAREEKLKRIVAEFKAGNRREVQRIGRELAEDKDPIAIPTLIAVIDADNSYDTIYGVGYFALGELTGVKYDESHDGKWWREWWEKNKARYPEEVRKLEIPKLTVKRSVRPAPAKRPSGARDVADIPSQDILIGGDPQKRYFLIGPKKAAEAAEQGFRLVVVLPGGDGGVNFHPFVKRIYKHGLTEQYLVAQLVAVEWSELKRNDIVWPTMKKKVQRQKFSTEEFVEAVLKDISGKFELDDRYIFTLSWSSGGPAAYAISLQKEKSVTGSFIAMSVFKPKQLPPLKNAKGHAYYLYHSPDDKVCPFKMVEAAQKALAENGANVKLATYSGGHGWRGNVYGDIRAGIRWLERQTRE